MMAKKGLPQKKSCETSELKLAAVLLAEIPESVFEIYPQGNDIKKVIRIIYLPDYETEVNKLIREFIERRAQVDVFRYNMALNSLRDKLREG